jgi:hypothetical protein
MSIFERKPLPLSAAPLYYQALAELTDKHWPRLWPRIQSEENEARAYLNLFRGEVGAFQSTVISHIDQQAKSQGSTAEKNKTAKDANAWIGMVRRAAKVASKRLPGKVEQEKLKTILHVGRELSRNSPGAVLLEARYLSAILPQVKRQISPPLHEAELKQGATLTANLEIALYGRANATAEQAKASVAKSKHWDVLEEKSKFLLEVARLEFSKEPEHADYATRLEFEGLDEKFASVTRAPEPAEDDNTPGAKK